MTETHLCGVCGHEIDPAIEQYSALRNTMTDETYDYVCETHDPFEVVGATVVVDGDLA